MNGGVLGLGIQSLPRIMKGTRPRRISEAHVDPRATEIGQIQQSKRKGVTKLDTYDKGANNFVYADAQELESTGRKKESICHHRVFTNNGTWVAGWVV